MSTTRSTPQAVDTSPRLNSRAVVALTGLSYLFVGLGFSYLDRGFGSFGLEGFMWFTWALLGFGAGIANVRKPDGEAGATQWAVMGAVGGLLAVFPGFIMFNLLRWVCVVLMVIVGARAAIVRTRRDFYLALVVIFVVSFMVGTHGNADWTLWFYLGPAWVFGGLALAWEHALGTPLSRWTKLSMTLGFIVASLVLTTALFLFMPRPAILGFGFLPPGTDTPGMFHQPAGGSGGLQRQGGQGASGAQGGGQSGAGTAQQGEWGRKWGHMLQGMRASMSDTFIPEWQRGIMDKLLGGAQALLDALTGSSSINAELSESQDMQQQQAESFSFTLNWLLLLLVLLAAFVLWQRRYRLGLALSLGGARLLAAHFPAQSMRLSAQSMKWCLRVKGHKRLPGQSVREHWVSATGMAPLARRWLDYAVESYCAMRFGSVPANTQRALAMHQAVQGACDIVMGLAPDLSR